MTDDTKQDSADRWWLVSEWTIAPKFGGGRVRTYGRGFATKAEAVEHMTGDWHDVACLPACPRCGHPRVAKDPLINISEACYCRGRAEPKEKQP